MTLSFVLSVFIIVDAKGKPQLLFFPVLVDLENHVCCEQDDLTSI